MHLENIEATSEETYSVINGVHPCDLVKASKDRGIFFSKLVTVGLGLKEVFKSDRVQTVWVR